jgi:hypothetical protein
LRISLRHLIPFKDPGEFSHKGTAQEAPDGAEQCLLFYFTQQHNLTVIQLAELELGADGKAFCNRNKYVPSTQPGK